MKLLPLFKRAHNPYTCRVTLPCTLSSIANLLSHLTSEPRLACHLTEKLGSDLFSLTDQILSAVARGQGGRFFK